MRAACRHLIGSHDFRHLCKMDVGNNVTEFRREILKAEIEALDDKDCENGEYFNMYFNTLILAPPKDLIYLHIVCI